MAENKIGLRESFSTLWYFIKLVHRIMPEYLPRLITHGVLQGLLPFVVIIGPKLIIDELTGNQDKMTLIILIAGVVLTSSILSMLIKIFRYKMAYSKFDLVMALDNHIGNKTIDINFEHIEDPEILDLKERAVFAIFFQGVLEKLIEVMTKAINAVIIIIGVGAIILTFNVFVLLMVVAMVIINGRVFKRIQEVNYETSQKSVPVNRAYGYFVRLSSDHVMAKDIRLYNMRPLILKKMKAFNERINTFFRASAEKVGLLNGITNVNLQIQSLLVYAYLVYRSLAGTLSIGNFMMYSTSISKFSDALRDAVSCYIEINSMAKYVKLLKEFDELPESADQGDILVNDDEYELSFENVWFKYPRSDEYTLKDVNVTIHPGDKVSVIGLNGAGKTTFIKLLTRLYEPTEGRITLNGVDIQEIDYDNYINKISAVFQDYRLLGVSIHENVTSIEHLEEDEEDVKVMLRKSGVMKDFEGLERGILTPLEKRYDKEATQLSGGQSQKIAIARALYKNAPIVVLDEPTAALDPIAEHEIYSKFHQLVGDKTAIYISHRLSSCQFCDRILVFDQGQIIQEGHHDELILQENQRYFEMYSAQAEYYA